MHSLTHLFQLRPFHEFMHMNDFLFHLPLFCLGFSASVTSCEGDTCVWFKFPYLRFGFRAPYCSFLDSLGNMCSRWYIYSHSCMCRGCSRSFISCCKCWNARVSYLLLFDLYMLRAYMHACAYACVDIQFASAHDVAMIMGAALIMGKDCVRHICIRYTITSAVLLRVNYVDERLREA